MKHRCREERTVAVPLPGPLDVTASLEVFRRWGDDLLDRWDGKVLVRTVRSGSTTVPYRGMVDGTVQAPVLIVTVQKAAHVPIVARAVKAMFVTAPEALAVLVRRDPLIARLEARYTGIRPVVQSDPFTALVRAITAQQVNMRWAVTVRRRLVEAFGRVHRVGAPQVFALDPHRLATASTAALRALQLTTRKAEAIIGLARAVTTGALDLPALSRLPDTEVIARLTALRGLGRWTAEWYLARVLGRPRVVAGDLGVRKAVGMAYLQGRLPTEAEVRELTAHWGEAACVAQHLLLHALSHGF